MKLELKLGLVTLSLSLSLSSSAQTTNTSVACPLYLGYILRIPWPSSYCRNDNRTECCSTLLNLYGIAFSKHLKETSLFRLSDLQTSKSEAHFERVRESGGGRTIKNLPECSLSL